MKFPEYFEESCFIEETKETIKEKVHALLQEMTLEEKAELCHGGMNPPFPGQVANGGYLKGVPRLGVPEIRMFDGPAGVTSLYETTGLPAEEMLASSWSRSLAREYGRITGSENRMISGNCQLGAEADLVRTTHFNRTRDMLGEDPYLASELIVPLVQGIQDEHVMAVLKHLAGYVISVDPGNTPDTVIDEQTMRELYLLPFERAVREGNAAGIMTTYSRINGPYAANSRVLLQDVLRRDWGFEGLAMCDWGGNHSFSLKNGMDMEMPMGAYNSTDRILRFLAEGKIEQADLDAAAGHVLYALGITGYLSLVTLGPDGCVLEEKDRTEPIRMPDHYADGARLREENAEAAEEIAVLGAVLLKNDDRTLPIACGKKIAVIGTGALRPVCGYGQERSYGTLRYMQSPYEAVREMADPSGHVTGEAGLDLVGRTIPQDFLFVNESGNEHGLIRTYGISEEDGYRPPMMSQGGGGEEFFGVASKDETEDDEDSLDFMPEELFKPGSDAAVMPGFAAGEFCSIDPEIDFTCKPGNKTWKNAAFGKAFHKGDAFTWKGFLLAPETGEYQINLHAIGGIAVLKMDVDGSGYRDIGLVKLREGTQWPWGNLVCTAEGMEVCNTRVHLEGGRRYPVMLYVKGMLDQKDMQVRLAWVTPSQRQEDLKAAVRSAEESDVTVLTLCNGFKIARNSAFGGMSFAEGTDLSLDSEQRELLNRVSEAVHRKGGKLVCAVYNGSAYAMGDWIDSVDALLYMWMPGQSGARALARILLGKNNPGGKLPQSFPVCNSDTPVTDTREHLTERWEGVLSPKGIRTVTASEGIYTGYRWFRKEKKQALFPFGYGLSYTSFAYSDAKAGRDENGPYVSFTIENTGTVAGTEIAQVYVSGGEAPDHVMLPETKLCGFERIENLAPGEKRCVRVSISERAMQYWDIQAEGNADAHWKYPAGERTLLIGASSEDIRLCVKGDGSF